jgi:type I restriction enzyme S subunit
MNAAHSPPECLKSGFPISWKLSRFKAVSRIRYGLGQPPPEFEGGVPVIRATDIDAGRIRDAGLLRVDRASLPLNRDVYLRESEIIVVRSGAYTGDSAIVRRKNVGAVAGYDLVVTVTRANPEFIAWCLLSDFVLKRQLELLTLRAAQAHLNARELGEIRVPLPPLCEQNRIAAYLEKSCAAIDAAVTAKRRQLQTLSVLADSIIHRAVTKGLDKDVAVVGPTIDWLASVPRHWKICQIKRRCRLLRGKFTHRPRNDPAYYDGDYPFVQTADITSARKYIRTYSQTLNELGFSVSKMFPRGTLVMSIAANVGDVAILDFEACFPDSMVGLIPDHRASLDFLYYLMRAMKGVLVRSAVQTTQLNLNYVRIGTNFAPFPPKREQEQIVEYIESKLDGVTRISNCIQSQIAALIAYRKSLIHECVTGQRRITDSDLGITSREPAIVGGGRAAVELSHA